MTPLMKILQAQQLKMHLKFYESQQCIAGHERCRRSGYGWVLGSKREASAPATIPGWHKSTPPPLLFRSACEFHYNVTSLPQFLRNSSWPELPLHSSTQRERKRRKEAVWCTCMCISYVTTCPCASVYPINILSRIYHPLQLVLLLSS